MARYRIVKDIDEKLPGDNIEKYIARDTPEHDEHHKVNYKSEIRKVKVKKRKVKCLVLICIKMTRFCKIFKVIIHFNLIHNKFIKFLVKFSLFLNNQNSNFLHLKYLI